MVSQIDERINQGEGCNVRQMADSTENFVVLMWIHLQHLSARLSPQCSHALQRRRISRCRRRDNAASAREQLGSRRDDTGLFLPCDWVDTDKMHAPRYRSLGKFD